MRYACFFIIYFLGASLLGQTTTIHGTVRDSKTKELLPFVNVAFQGTKVGVTTDMDGRFSIQSYYATDTLVASFVGYNLQKKKILKGKTQTVEFLMESSEVNLEAVVITASKKDENPAHAILKAVIDNKKINNKEKLDAYQYELYNKIQFSVRNLNPKVYDKKIIKGLSVVKNYLDTVNGNIDLPMFLTETMSDFYFKKSPKVKREFIKATKVSGVDNNSVSQFLGDMYQNINIYEDSWVLFNQSFTSPIHDLALWSYKYYLVDSAWINSQWCYKLDFVPKQKQANTFSGHLWIHDTTYAIKSVEAVLSEGANINWVKNFTIRQSFIQAEKEVWMLSKDELLVEFEMAEGKPGILGHKTTTYRQFLINQPKEEEFYKGNDEIIVLENSKQNNLTFWDSTRHESLSEKEANIYQMIDTIQKLPVYRTVFDLVQLFVMGYKVMGPIELGPYYTLYSFNPIEGNRFKIGGRTSNAFSTKIMLDGYLAYGLKDKQFKYGIGGMGFITKKPRQIVGFHYQKDLEQLGQGLDSWRQDNILSSVFRRNPATRLNGFEEYHFNYEYEWFYGLMNMVDVRKREIWPLGQVVFSKDVGSVYEIQVPSIRTFEWSLTTRFAYKERYVSGEFTRLSLGTKWPVMYFTYTMGLKGIWGSQYDYHRTTFRLQDYIHIHPIGYSVVNVEAGKVFGHLPYPLLEIHNGNETYSYDNTAFNLMNFYEFVSDQYASMSVTHHWNGFFLNKIPLLRKLKWREITQARGVYGQFNPHNLTELNMPATTSYFSKNKPYIEAGLGLENIFKFLRIDGIWRMTYIDPHYVNTYQSNINSTKIARWGIRGTIQIIF